MTRIVLVRHGETEWTLSHRHTGQRTDLPLTETGERQAYALRRVLEGYDFAFVLTSPLQRAARTAEIAGLAGAQVDDDLAEWDYGEVEGRTTAEIEAEHPGWSIWTDGPVGGETADEVGARADRVLARVREAEGDAGTEGGDIALVAHGHFLRVLTARWLGLSAAGGAYFALGTATFCELGREHDRPVIKSWNIPAEAISG